MSIMLKPGQALSAHNETTELSSTESVSVDVGHVTGSAGGLRAFPTSVQFDDVEVGVLYVMTLVVQNITKESQRIRFIPPRTEAFTLTYSPSELVAPGLEIRADVEFQAGEQQDYHDKLIITTARDRIEIPLHAYIPSAKFAFDGFVNLGVVVQGNTTAKYIDIKNEGSRPGEFNILYDKALPLTITPSHCKLQPPDRVPEDGSGDGEGIRHTSRSQVRIKVEVQGRELGVFRALAQMDTIGASLAPYRVLDVNATVVEQHLELVLPDGGGTLTGVHFGTVYYGEQRTITALLVNNGPQPSSFHLTLDDGDEGGDATGGGDADSSAASAPCPITAMPREGVIQPYAQLPIQFVFKPTMDRRRIGFKANKMYGAPRGPGGSSTAALSSAAAASSGGKGATDGRPSSPDVSRAFSIGCVLECLDTKQQIELDVTAKAIKPRLELSARSLQFGEVATGSHAEMLLTVRNGSSEMPLSFSINRVAHFRPRPSSGRLRPLQSMNVVLSFSPSQMGRFNTLLHAVMNDGVMVVPLRLRARSTTVGPKKKLVGGVDKVAADFRPQFTFVRPEEVAAQTPATFKRIYPWEETAADMEQLFEMANGSIYTYGIQDLVKKQKHKDQYTTYLRTCAKHRVKKEAAALRATRGIVDVNDDPDGIDLGMAPRGGMESPRLALPSAQDPLWLQADAGGVAAKRAGTASSSAGGGGGGGSKHFDENKLIARKFKTRPTTQVEAHDCACELRPDQLLMVHTGPKSIDFGEVSVNTVVKKSFSVANDLSQNILVVLHYSEEELQGSSPPSQVVPSGATAGFDIVFCALTVGPFDKMVTYIMNDTHTLKFHVSATVVAAALRIAPDHLVFRFPDGSLDSAVTEVVTLSNPGTAAVDYSWDVERGSSFSIVPQVGSVEAGRTVEAEVTFAPVFGAPNDVAIPLVIKNRHGIGIRHGGSAGVGAVGVGPGVADEEEGDVLSCVGELEEAKATFVEKRVDMGMLAVGLLEERTVALKNVGRAPAVFAVTPPTESLGVSISPMQGRIPVGESLALRVRLRPSEPRQYRDVLIGVSVRGGRSLRLPLVAQAVVPKVSLHQDEFDFGGITIGAVSRLLLRLENEGDIPAVLHVDFSSHKEFSLEVTTNPAIPSDATDITDAETASTGRAGSAGRHRGAGTPGGAAQGAEDGVLVPLTSRRSRRGRRKEARSREKEEECHKFRITAAPHTSLFFNLVFAPTAEAEHAFELPLSLAGMPSGPELRRAVVGEGVRPRLLLSATEVPFGSKVVARDRIKKFPYYSDLTMTNRDSVPLSFSVGMDVLLRDTVRGVFVVEPSEGRLESGETRAVRVSFLPEDARDYQVSVPLYLDGDTSRPYLQLSLTGSGMFPQLSFDRDEVIMPTVPLGVRSSITFTLVNTGYDNLELRYRLPPDNVRVPLSVEFPAGQTVGIAKPRLPVVVSFMSRRPMAFTAKLDFLDGEGNRFGIPVTGMCDNCVLTTYPFLASTQDTHGFYARDGKPVQLLERKQLLSLEKAARKSRHRSTSVFVSSMGTFSGVPPPVLTPGGAGVGLSAAEGGLLDGIAEDGAEGDVMELAGANPSAAGGRALTTSGDDTTVSEMGESKYGGTGADSRRMSRAVSVAPSRGRAVMDSEAVTDAQRRCARDLLRWLNATALRSHMQQFPEDITSAQGKPVLDMMEALCNRSVPGRVTRLSTNKRDAAVQLMAQYAEMLTFLKSNGALLHQVRPEALLARDEYVRARLAKLPLPNSGKNAAGSAADALPDTASTTGGSKPSTVPGALRRAQRAAEEARALPAAVVRKYRSQFRAEFPADSMAAWLAVIYQTIKVFVLSRVTLRQFRNLPGLLFEVAPDPAGDGSNKGRSLRRGHRGGGGNRGDGTATGTRDRSGPSGPAGLTASGMLPRRLDKDGTLNGSNTYCVSENLLLKWVTYHLHKTNPMTPRRILTFDADLADGSVLCYLLLAHVPGLAQSGRPLSGFHRNPTTRDHALNNATRIVSALKELSLDFAVTPEELVRPLPQSNMLFLFFLYQNLPQFIPKTTVLFSGALGQKISKSIELRNPSKRAITYWVSLTGSTDFKVGTRQLYLEPGSTHSVPVEFLSRFSRVAEGRLTFKASRDGAGGSNASTMVFVLRSEVMARAPTRTLQLSARLYELEPREVEVTNPFTQDCNFSVTLLQERPPPEGAPGAANGAGGGGDGSGEAAAGRGRRQARRRGRNARRVVGRDGEPQLPEAFYCKPTSLRVRAGQSAILPVEFLPFQLGVSKCHLVFLDDSVGEFVYELQGTAELPAPVETIRFKTELRPELMRDLVVARRSVLLERAQVATIERYSGSSKTRARDALKSLTSHRAVAMQVEFNSPYFSTAPELVLPETAPSRGSSAKSQVKPPGTPGTPSGERGGNSFARLAAAAAGGPAVQLSYTFHPRGAGLYPAKLVLRSPADVRVYHFEVTVTAPGVKKALEFTAPARQKITQEIPITNSSNFDWALRASINGSETFTGPGNLRVPKGGSATYPLSFLPSWVCSVEGTLQLSNPDTTDAFEYALVGVGEEPLAEDHIVIKCQARQRLTHTFPVRNESSTVAVTYAVESDLPHVSGESSLNVAVNSTGGYELSIHPLLGGTYTGSVTFTAPDGKFYWYTVEVRASAPEPEDTLEIAAFVRKAVSVEISLANPLSRAVEFEVVLVGAGLLGDPTFVLAASETATYELLYAPLVPGVVTGSVSFVNDDVGEVWYNLRLTADPAPPVPLEVMRCPVGTRCTQTVRLENPTGTLVELKGSVTNKRNFSVSPPVLSLPPYGSADVSVEYTPSSLNEDEESGVSFFHPKLGRWEYTVTGSGSPPSIMDTVVVTSAVGVSNSSVFNFRNPFPRQLTVDVLLIHAVVTPDANGNVPDMQDLIRNGGVTSGAASSTNTARTGGGGGGRHGSSHVTALPVFQLILKRQQNIVAPFANLQVPFMFSPTDISDYRCTVLVRAEGSGDGLQWTFPLRGIAEAPAEAGVIEFRTRARDRVSRHLELVLHGLKPEQLRDGAAEALSHELVVPDEFRPLLSRALTITPLDTTLRSSEEPVRYHVSFQPLRPFKTPVEFIINKASGGRWRYQMLFEAEEPDIDDVIVIEATLNRTSSVAFRLSNQFPSFAPFTAAFTPDSPYEFTVFPSSGMLEPYGRDGTNFVVSYTPSEYGKMLTGRLVITTDDMQWSYELRGTHPEYRAPSGKSRVSSHLDQRVARELDAGATRTPRNILRENMKGVKSNAAAAARKTAMRKASTKQRRHK